MIYDIKVSIDLGRAVPEVGALCDNLNHELAKFGLDEKLSIWSALVGRTLTSDRELTTEEIDKVKTLFTQEFSAKFPTWNVKVEVIRRKSGNVQQSVSQ